MRTAWLEPPSLRVQGDQIYRTVQPASALAQCPKSFVVAGHWLQPPMHYAAETADLLVLCQAIDIDFVPLLLRRRAAGRATLVELNDNFLEPRAFGEVGNFYHAPAQASLAMQLAELADGLLVSTPYLAELFGPLNANTLVLPNSVARLAELVPERVMHHQLRLGWAGSAGHRPDLEALVPVLRKIMQQHGNVTLCIMAPASLHDLFTWVPRHRLDLREASSLESYLDFISSWHVGLAPLRDTPFNRGRSDVKFLEYASMGVPIIVSQGPAYHTVIHNETGVVVRDFAGFEGAITALLNSAEHRQHLRAQAHRYVALERQSSVTSSGLEAFVAERMGGRKKSGLGISARWFERITAQRSAPWSIDGSARMGYLQSTPAEALLFEALRAQQGADAARGSAWLLRAQRAMPSCYLPYLFAGAHCKNSVTAERLLLEARALAPQSAAVAYHLTRTHLMGRAPDRALAAVASLPNAQQLSYAPLLELMAQAHGLLSNVQAQHQSLRQALVINPHYGPPACALAACALGEGGPQAASYAPELASEAEQALLHNTGSHRPTVMDWFYLGRLAAAAGRPLHALEHFEKAQALAAEGGHHEAQQLCCAWLAKVALALGDAPRALAYLERRQDDAARYKNSSGTAHLLG